MMPEDIPPDWDGAQRRRYLDALVAYVHAPGPETSRVLRSAAPGVEDTALAFATALVHHPRSAWWQRLQELRDGLEWPSVVPLPEPRTPDAYLDPLDRPTVQLAWFAYWCFPSPISHGSLRTAAGTEAGDWLANLADALRTHPGSAWHRKLVARWSGHDGAAWSEPSAATTTTPAPAPAPAPATGRLLRHRPRRSLAWAAAVAATAVALVVGATAVALVRGSPPAPSGPAHLATWQVTGAIDQPAWQVAAGGGAASPLLACPAPTACFAGVPGGSGGSVVEVSTDRGASWSAHPLPGGVRLTAPLACPTPTTCVGAGIVPSAAGPDQAEVVVTSDGGSSWAEHPLPAGVARVTALACPAVSTCIGAASAGTPSTAAATTSQPTITVTSTDAGSSWSTAALPSPVTPTANGLACSSPADCVLVGATAAGAAGSSATTTAAALTTSDGGAQWAAAAVPHGLGPIRAVSCARRGGCVAFADHGPGTAPDHYAVLRSSTPDGRSWRTAAGAGFSLAFVSSISCPASGDCWVSGRSAPAAGRRSAGALVDTRDGGTSWTAAALPRLRTATGVGAPGAAPLDLVTVSAVSCADVALCVALGQAAFSAPTAAQVVLRDGGT
jgi:hypothetical protein